MGVSELIEDDEIHPDIDHDAATGPTPDEGTDERVPPARRRVDRGLLIACLVIAGGLALIIWGMTSALTGSDGVERPDAIEDLVPVENAVQVVQQSSVIVDLQFGYEAVLIIDGIELETSRIGESTEDLEPGQQQTTDPRTAVFDPGNARISFQPTEGAPIESFSQGLHTAQVIYWRIEDGRDNGARSYRWTFNVV